MKIFRLPDLGEGLPDAEIHEWHVAVGTHVKIDQPLVSMETAKAVVEVPAPFDGIIAELHGAVGDIINTGDALVSFEGEADKPKTIEKPKSEETKKTQ
jgi:2-oxoisovalerate dehydrogenase E2 component (dihydrolipoyl transacylase)